MGESLSILGGYNYHASISPKERESLRKPMLATYASGADQLKDQLTSMGSGPSKGGLDTIQTPSITRLHIICFPSTVWMQKDINRRSRIFQTFSAGGAAIYNFKSIPVFIVVLCKQVLSYFTGSRHIALRTVVHVTLLAANRF